MIQRDQIRSAVSLAIERVKELSLDDRELNNEESTVLFGPGAALDSMGFVNFVVALEDEMVGISGPLDLVEILNSQEQRTPPISTVGQLVDLLCRLNQSSPPS
jgi:acyl carrier protein